MQQSIDISCPLGPQQQTHHTGVRQPNDGIDGGHVLFRHATDAQTVS